MRNNLDLPVSARAVLVDCGHMSTPMVGTTGYATDSNGKTLCFDCCADKDREYMRRHGTNVLYLDEANNRVTNWPGTLSLPCRVHSRWNVPGFNGTRVPIRVAYFIFDGHPWSIRVQGDMDCGKARLVRKRRSRS